MEFSISVKRRKFFMELLQREMVEKSLEKKIIDIENYYDYSIDYLHVLKNNEISTLTFYIIRE